MFRPVPVLTEVFDAIENEEPWRPETRPSFLSALGSSSLAPIVHRVPSVPRVPVALLVSGASPAGAVFLSTNFGYLSQEYKDSSVTFWQLRDLIGDDVNPFPTLPLSHVDGQLMCLAFYYKGFCNPNYGRITDHVSCTDA